MELTDFNLFILALGSIGLGILMLIKGGDWTIDSAVVIAERAGIPKMIIGFTIVAFGTSLPELIVSVNANLKGVPGIALGNVIGSNVANILLVIATAALFAPIVVSTKAILKDTLVLFGSTALFAYVMIGVGAISSLTGLIMVAILFAYVGYQLMAVRKDKKHAKPLSEIEEEHAKPHAADSMTKTLFLLVLGLAAVALGAEILVRGAEVAATIAGVPSALIGLTIVAIGTSLPELSTCLLAVKKGEGDIVLGNVMGSNVFNILMIIGVTSAIKAIPGEAITPQLIDLDIIVMTVISFVFGGWMLWRGKLSRTSGAIMLGLYIGYMALLYFAYMT